MKYAKTIDYYYLIKEKYMKKTYLFLSIILILTIVSGCGDGLCTRGNGTMFTQTRTLNNFDRIILEIGADVFVTQAETQSVNIIAQDEILDKINMSVSNGELLINYAGCVNSHDGIQIFISLPELSRITNVDTGLVMLEGYFEVPELEIFLDGRGDILCMNLNVTELLNSKIYGAGNLTFMGSDTIQNHFIEINGFGNVKAYSFPTYDVKIRNNNSGHAYLQAISNLDVQISGSGNIYYKGHPHLDIDDNGIGEVINSNL